MLFFIILMCCSCVLERGRATKFLWIILLETISALLKIQPNALFRSYLIYGPKPRFFAPSLLTDQNQFSAYPPYIKLFSNIIRPSAKKKKTKMYHICLLRFVKTNFAQTSRGRGGNFAKIEY